MYCKKCGAQLDDNAKFCYVCGAQVTENAPVEKPNPKHRYVKPNCKPKKKGLIAIAAVIAVLLALAVGVSALVFSGTFGNDTVKVAAALTKSGKAFTDAAGQMALTDVSSLVESKKINQEFSLWINEIDGSSDISGIGARISLDSDLPGRNISMAVTPFWGSADLVTLQTKLYDSEVYVGSPELTGGTFYMINTETICADLERMGADMGEAANLSFNIFDIIEYFQELNEGTKEWTKAVKEGAAALVQEVEVTKTGAETIDVNGAALDCTAYDVMIPESALHTYLNSIKDAYYNVDNTGSYGQMLESMGIPADIVNEMESAMEDPTEGIEETFNQLHQALTGLGDIHLNLYLNDGYVVALEYKNSFNDVEVALILNIGGGDNYVDNISFRAIAGKEEYRITSTGNHAGTNNVFTDVTVVEYWDNGQVTPLVQLDSTYAPKEVEDNFRFAIKSEGATLELSGQLTCDEDFLNLYLNKIAVAEYGEALAVVGMEYSISKYGGDSFSVNKYDALAGMTQDDLMAIAQELTTNATNWAMNLDSDIQNKLMDIAYDFF